VVRLITKHERSMNLRRKFFQVVELRVGNREWCMRFEDGALRNHWICMWHKGWKDNVV